MPPFIPDHSVGLVTPQTAQCNAPFNLACGQTLSRFELVYETYGTLNPNRDNAILICHALSGDHHAAGYHSMDDQYPGWWEEAIGPNKPIDTNHFFVVSCNNLGGCSGSTGPTSINPDTKKSYAGEFPLVTVRDWIRSQRWLMQQLNIPKWSAVIGGSLGGMQALQWSIDFPELLDHCVAIASAPNLTAQNIAFNEVARQAIIKDPDFHGGHYAAHGTLPRRGLQLARMLGHITYLSDDAMGKKFGRALQGDQLDYGFKPEFQVESYLHYQGEKFSQTFDANTYLLMTKALDYFDPAYEYHGKLSAAFEQSDVNFLIMSFTTDWRFDPSRSREIVSALLEADKRVSYIEIESENGHDAFLLGIAHYMDVFGAYMKNILLH